MRDRGEDENRGNELNKCVKDRGGEKILRERERKRERGVWREN